MFCQLGSIIFESLKSPNSITSNEGAVYAEHALINSKPRLQPTGAKLKDISLSFKLHASFCNIEAELQALRDAIEKFTVMPLLWGNGRLEGNFIATDLSIDFEETDTFGSKVSITCTVPLKEYFIKDPINKKQQEARQNSFATGDKKPPVKSGRVNPVTSEQEISRIISAIKSRAKQINTTSLAYTNTGRQNNDIKRDCGYIKELSARLISKNEASIISDAKNVNSESIFFIAFDPANIPGIKNENNTLQNRVRLLERAASPIIQKAATRH